MPTLFITDNMCTSYKLELKRFQDYFEKNGWEVITSAEKADLIIVGTCVGFDELEEESLKSLSKFNATGKKVATYGCLTKFNPDALIQVHKGTSIASDDGLTIASIIENPLVPFSAVPPASTFRCKEDYRLFDLSKRYIAITQGCSFRCSFCPHRIGIGPMRSRPIADIVEQITNLKGQGVNIVVLTGLETGGYGRDIGSTYPELLRTVLNINASFQIHVSQFSPTFILKYEKELTELLSNDRVTDIQVPVQTTSNRLLRLMRRSQDIAATKRVFDRIREMNPKTILRTDLMVGFPTETEEEFLDSMQFVTDVFDEVAVYAFEAKRGVPLSNMNLEACRTDIIRRRVAMAIDHILAAGKLAHTGAQGGTNELFELEQRKERMREAKHSNASRLSILQS